MPNWFALLADDSGPAIHIAPGAVLHIGSFAITNSILYGWASIVVILIVMVTIARRMTVWPKGGVIQLVEMGTEFILQTIESGFEDKNKARKYAPFFVTLFFFLLINNWLGLLPGVGDAITINGVPLLRPFTGDLNGTLAAGVVTMVMVYGSSIKEFGGPHKYLRHFFIGTPLNPFYLFIGLIEITTDLTRVFSLALRLFLNVAIGETIIAIFTYLGQIAAPVAALPFTFMELFVGAVQAFIFTTLSAMYLAAAVNHVYHQQHESNQGATTHEPLTVEAVQGSSHA